MGFNGCITHHLENYTNAPLRDHVQNAPSWRNLGPSLPQGWAPPAMRWQAPAACCAVQGPAKRRGTPAKRAQAWPKQRMRLPNRRRVSSLIIVRKGDLAQEWLTRHRAKVLRRPVPPLHLPLLVLDVLFISFPLLHSSQPRLTLEVIPAYKATVAQHQQPRGRPLARTPGCR